MKVNELSGALLDYWVARAEGWRVRVIDACSWPFDDKETQVFMRRNQEGFLHTPTIGIDSLVRDPEEYSPSTDWAHGGPIIEREHMNIVFVEERDEQWCADAQERMSCPAIEYGPTLLIAAMRAYVASKFGDEVLDDPAAPQEDKQ